MAFSHRHPDHDNAPLVALHASASSSGQWKKLKADLEGRFDVFAYDLPGYGTAPLQRDTSQFGAASAAQPVIAEIEKFGRAVHLVGHSNGAGIALKVALLRPDLVKSLTLYEPAAFHFLKGGDSREKGFYAQIKGLSAQVRGAAMRADAATGLRHFLDFWNGAGFWDALPVSAQHRFEGLISAIVADFANGFAETWQLQDLSQLTMPSMVMTGLDSPDLAQHVSLEIAKALPNARSVLMPEFGHMAPVFQPEWINTRILEHVARIERPGGTCNWPTRAAA